MKAPRYKVNGRLWLTPFGKNAPGHGRVDLLERIHASGSISQAARDVGISYKAAWDAVETMNNLADSPLVERSAGGLHGGGTRLTVRGERLIEVHRAVDAQFQGFLARLDEGIADFGHFYELMKGMGMRTSARNELAGTIKTITRDTVNAEVVLDIGGNDELVAVITHASVENLHLRPGMAAYALIKAPWVILADAEGMRTSARNRLCGKVETVESGEVSAEVTVALAGGKRITAIVTRESVQSMNLQTGSPTCALVKASHVIIAVSA